MVPSGLKARELVAVREGVTAPRSTECQSVFNGLLLTLHDPCGGCGSCGSYRQWGLPDRDRVVASKSRYRLPTLTLDHMN